MKKEKTNKTTAKKRNKREEKGSSVPFFRSIQLQLIASFLVPVVFIVILGVTSFQNAAASVVNRYETSVNQTMQMMNQYLALVFDTVQSNYKGYVNDDTLVPFYKGLYDSDPSTNNTIPRTYRTTLNANVTADAMISNIYILSDKEQSILTGRELGNEQLYSAYLETAQGAIVAGDRYKFFLLGNQCEIDEKLGTSSDKYGARLARYLKEANAILLVDISEECVENTLHSLDGGENSYVGFVTMDGNEYIRSSEAELTQPVFQGTEFYENALSSEENSGSEYVTYQGEQYLFLFSKIVGRDAMICTLIPEENIISQVSDIKTVSVILVVLASVVAIGLGSVLARSFGKTINNMIFKLKKVGKGDLTVQITTKRRDEFRMLAEGITDMVNHMQELIASVMEASNELSQAAGKVEMSAKTFVETSDGIKNAISEIESGTSKLDTDSADCLEQMDSLSTKMGVVTNSATEISELTDSTGEAIASGMSSMTELNRSAASTTEITAQVIIAIQVLEEKSRSIGKIINTINEIAEETNLLSLNASIEAARAGEAGRGFAVVAEEIKKLADQSMSSAAEIEEIVEEIIAGTGEVVQVAQKAEEIVKSQEEAVTNTAGSFEKMDKKVGSLMDSLSMINQNVENMEHARATTLAAIESISAISAETAAGSATVFTAAETQMDAITELNEASRKLARRAEDLSSILQRFTI